MLLGSSFLCGLLPLVNRNISFARGQSQESAVSAFRLHRSLLVLRLSCAACPTHLRWADIPSRRARDWLVGWLLQEA